MNEPEAVGQFPNLNTDINCMELIPNSSHALLGTLGGSVLWWDYNANKSK
jgi:hypothetical protein